MDVAKKFLVSLVLISAAAITTGCAQANQLLDNVFPNNKNSAETFPPTPQKCESTAVANQFIVRWKDGTTVIYKGHTRQEILKRIVEPNADKIEFAEQDQRISAPKQPVRQLTEAAVSPDDWGQTITNAQAAWDQGYTGTGVLVAVIDSGVQRDHPQLAPQMYVNPGESGIDTNTHKDKSSDGVDNDGNGFIDDVSGWDFALNKNNVVDGTGHGTHVSGIIAAKHAAGAIKGIAEGAKILPLDFMDDDGSGNISDAISAMYYAAKMGATVVNASWGGAPCSTNLQKAIQDLGDAGVLFVNAAGNSGVSLDQYPEYPAAFGLPTQVTVVATTTRDYMSSYSNYSYGLTNLAAPGDQILSTYPTSSTQRLSGTSMATPFVVGAAAILKGARPNATPAQIKAALIASVDSAPVETSSRGRLNIGKALTEILKLPQ